VILAEIEDFRHIQTRRLDTRLGEFTVFDLPVDSKLKPSHSDVYSLRYGARFFRVVSDLHKISRRPESEPRYLETCRALALNVAPISSKFNMNTSIVYQSICLSSFENAEIRLILRDLGIKPSSARR
jgi:hypothetical protein